MLQTFIFTLLLLLTIRFDRSPNNAKLSLIGVVAGFSVLARPDSIILAVPLLTWLILKNLKPSRIIRILFPFIAIVGLYLIWKQLFYGPLLPNTFFAKTNSTPYLFLGFQYVMSFFQTYLLIPAVIVVILRFRFTKVKRVLTPFVVSLFLWLTYLVFIGGDFMEYRFFVPFIPLIYLLVLTTIVSLSNSLVRATIIATLLVGPIFYHLSFSDMTNRYCPFVAKASTFNEFYFHPTLSWKNAGVTLGEALNFDASIVVATGSAGMIPYYSRLKNIDVLGLNDDWVSRHGVPYQKLPGHRIIAPLNYLIEKQPNLLIGNPTYSTLNNPDQFQTRKLCRRMLSPAPDYDCSTIPITAKSIEIPLNDSVNLVAIYLTPHPTIDAAIIKYDWKIKELTD